MAPAERGRRPPGKRLLKEKLELENVKGRDGRPRVTLKPIEDELTFDKGFYVFIRALQLLRSHNEGVVLVGLGGASGSGKTAFSEKVKDFMPGIAVISMDNYNDGSKVVDSNFDDPRLTDYDLLLTNLADLRAGKPADVPIYDFKQSARVGYNSVPVPASRVVIIEGIYALSERLRPLLDLRVSIAGGVHFDLVKRVLRDINRSGQGPEEIIQQITDTVFPMYKAFIEPDLRGAQLRIHNSFNPFTGFMNATYILKAPRPPGLAASAVAVALGEGMSSRTEAELYDIHLLPPAEDPETCASWLRMRNRDGRYTLMFEEWVTEGDFIISPRIQFEVSVRVLGGLMALGYEIGTIMRRTSTIMAAPSGDVTVKFDDVENLGRFVQVQGKDRERVASVASALGLSGFLPRSYIEQVQLAKLTQEFSAFTEDVRRRFSMGSNAHSVDDAGFGASPPPFGGLLSLGMGVDGGPRRAGLQRGGGTPGRYGSSRSGRGGRALGGDATAAGARAGAAAAGGSRTTTVFGDSEDEDEDDGLLPVPVCSDAHDGGLLSSSAPVRGSRPIAIGAPIGRPNRGAAAAGDVMAATADNGASDAAGAAAAHDEVAAAAAGVAPVGGGLGSPSASSVSGVAVAASTVGCGSVDSRIDYEVPSTVAAAAVGLSGALLLTSSNTDCGLPPAAMALGAAAVPRHPNIGTSGGGGSSSSSSSAMLRSSGLLGQQLRRSSNNGTACSLANSGALAAGLTSGVQLLAAEQPGDAGRAMRASMAGTIGCGPDAQLFMAEQQQPGAAMQLLRRLAEQMSTVADGFRRHSGMQLHLDALTVQYKTVNESLAALSTTTAALADAAAQLQAASSGNAGRRDGAALCAALGIGALLGAATTVLLARRSG